MDEPKSLDSLFKDKIFRIPDYQRGYAWQQAQLKDFWEDLINLSGSRSHYTGVLTLKQIAKHEIKDDTKEHWLVKGHSYNVHHVVDGQQRLTTFIISLQAFVDCVIALPENINKTTDAIYISDSLSVADIEKRFLFKIKPTGDQFRTYKFGYSKDNPSDSYLRFEILKEPGGGNTEETFYTLNLSNAYHYFHEQFKNLHTQDGTLGLEVAFEKLTQRFLFNEYVIKDEFDVFVAFETMNNRGKKLSDLELLKNRLIYLTTLYDDHELDAASRKNLRDDINDAWKYVYHQLGRNKNKPLNDDDFLRAHWTMYFKYSRETGKDYIRFLLEEQFSPKKVHQKVAKTVVLNDPIENLTTNDLMDQEDESYGSNDIGINTHLKQENRPTAYLQPIEIRDYVKSLKDSAAHWFTSWYPDLNVNTSENERRWLDCLNRIGITYFRTLVMSILKNEASEPIRIQIFQQIERFIFIAFRLNSAQASYGSSEFHNLARALDRKEKNSNHIFEIIKQRLSYAFNEDASLSKDDFHNVLTRKFRNGTGYYGWSGLRYFLYEYETSLLAASRQRKITWNDLLKSDKDKISIEHIYPQTETPDWAAALVNVAPENRKAYAASLGNLLLLSMSINSSLQNDSFNQKKHIKKNPAGDKLRNGFADGSHSEIEVAQLPTWGALEIEERGKKLLTFMESRWDFKFRSDEKPHLLFLNSRQI